MKCGVSIRLLYLTRALVLLATMAWFAGCRQNKKITLALQPFESFDGSLTDTVANILQATYDIRVVTLESAELPASAFVNSKSKRYRADILIQILKNTASDSIDYVMGMTTKDISFTKRDAFGRIKSPERKYADWGIFGLGYSPGRSRVVSTFRIRNSSDQVRVTRLKKIAVHEFGHNLGLGHCDIEHCVMRDAVETITTIDHVDVALCASCKSKL
jgi:archaemetzincin